ncbi:conserved hypothetical protein [Neospora caninum Liverpool]|uniref:2-C-methyl-D-erythritol 4-phosphate cytidylyltransferase n=1 Tax=Neospora caninum (strain Liverpool) TaxID=572307 RepID=F0VB50_NEOCL|nr:conserved hypothetical protein [Neospora caninum Liverpool]CBZ51387.1 conserved hypothetical protein [Neospora caninum Liverpool]|eukprot:XP_003881420.1 conserved hypothetical protein [Neospora caninum Liverpool]
MACGGVGSRFGGETPKQFVPLFRGQTAAQISLEKLRRHLARSGAGCPEASTRRQFQQETDEREFPKAKKRGQSFLVAVVDRERRAAVMKRSTNEEETENCEARGRMAATGAGSEGGDQCLDGLNEHDISLGHVSTRSNPLHGREGRDDHRRTPVEVLFAPVGAERWESVWHGVKCLCYSLLATEKGRKLREISAPVLRSDTNPSLREGHVGNEKESTHGQSRSRFRSLCRALSSLPRYVASAFMSKFHYVVPGGSQLAPDTTQVACNSARMNAGGLQTGSKGNVSEVATAQADEARHLLHRLAAINCDKDLVMIHDAARPCVREEDLENVTSDAEKFGAALLAVPAVSSIKVATADRHGRLCPASPCSGEKSVTRGKDPTAADRDKATGHEDFFVQRTLPRHLLWEAQTPQVRTHIFCAREAYYEVPTAVYFSWARHQRTRHHHSYVCHQ